MTVRTLLLCMLFGFALPAHAEGGAVGTKCSTDDQCALGLRCNPAGQVCTKSVFTRLKSGCDAGDYALCGELANGYLTGEFSIANAPLAVPNVPSPALKAEHPQAAPDVIQIAVGYFIKGCEGGDAFSCYQLGGIYVGMIGQAGTVPKNIRTAVRAWRRGCEKGSSAGAAACFALAMAYQKGSFGIPRTPSKATKYFRKGCDAGNRDACAALEMPIKPTTP